MDQLSRWYSFYQLPETQHARLREFTAWTDADGVRWRRLHADTDAAELHSSGLLAMQPSAQLVDVGTTPRGERVLRFLCGPFLWVFHSTTQ